MCGRWLRDTGMDFLNDLAVDRYGDEDDRRPPLVLLHGLTYDRRHWEPFARELSATDPHRRVIAIDLPGHGESAAWASYGSDEVVDAIHGAVVRAGLESPVVVGHSLGAVLATVYGGRYPVTGVVNVDQALGIGGFKEVLRQLEPVLRGPDWRQVWDRMTTTMHIELLPPEAREIVTRFTDPRQDLLLGYWNEVLVQSAEQLTEARARELGTLAALGRPYVWVTGTEPDPAQRQWMTDLVPRMEITVMPGSGHFPHLAHPARLAMIAGRL